MEKEKRQADGQTPPTSRLCSMTVPADNPPAGKHIKALGSQKKTAPPGYPVGRGFFAEFISNVPVAVG